MLLTSKTGSLTKPSPYHRTDVKNHHRCHHFDHHLAQDIPQHTAFPPGQSTHIVSSDFAKGWLVSDCSLLLRLPPKAELIWFVGSIYFGLVVSMLIYITTSCSLLSRLLTTINVLGIVFRFTTVSYLSRYTRSLCSDNLQYVLSRPSADLNTSECRT